MVYDNVLVTEEVLKCKEGREDEENFKATTSNNCFLFDDEVASLLVVMRDRIEKPQTFYEPKTEQCDNSAIIESEVRNKKRKFPGDSDEECEVQEEPDDDEWMEESGYFSHTLISKTVRKKAPSGSACEKHKRWKKRCPDDCPMRKATKSHLDQPNYFEMVQWSLIELKEDYSEEDEDRVQVPDDDDDEDVEFMSKKRREENSFEDRRETKRKSKKGSKSKGRSSRKYLPQACERHKVLHAKCPANCPDRLKRDADAKQRYQPPGSSSSSEDLLNDLAL